MTDKVQHPLFGLVNPNCLAFLASIAQRQLAAFSLEETDWKARAQEVLNKLIADIDVQHSPESKSRSILKDVKLTEAPFAAFLCQEVVNSNCTSAHPDTLKANETIALKLSACILVIVLLGHENPKNAHANKQALDSARILRKQHPDLLPKLAPFLDGSAAVLHEKLSDLSKDDSLTAPQQRPFNRIAALLRKQMKTSPTTQSNGDPAEDPKFADDGKTNTEHTKGNIIRIKASEIDPSPFPHRLEDSKNAADLEILRRSMQEDGQDTPIVVRPHPKKSGRYEIVCGSRRLLTAQQVVESNIEAVVKDLDDIELLTAQGRENSFRREASYIEKVRLAGHMFKLVSDYEQAKTQLMSALSIDHTEASRLKAVNERLPSDIIECIGAAPKIGRNRWSDLADLLAKSEHIEAARRITQHQSFKDLTSSDDRFLYLLKEIEAKPVPPKPTTLMSGNTKLGKLAHKAKRSDIQMPNREFATFVAEKLHELYEDFKKQPEWADG